MKKIKVIKISFCSLAVVWGELWFSVSWLDSSDDDAMERAAGRHTELLHYRLFQLRIFQTDERWIYGLTADDDEVNGRRLIVEQSGQLNSAVVETRICRSRVQYVQRGRRHRVSTGGDEHTVTSAGVRYYGDTSVWCMSRVSWWYRWYTCTLPVRPLVGDLFLGGADHSVVAGEQWRLSSPPAHLHSSSVRCLQPTRQRHRPPGHAHHRLRGNCCRHMDCRKESKNDENIWFF